MWLIEKQMLHLSVRQWGRRTQQRASRMMDYFKTLSTARFIFLQNLLQLIINDEDAETVCTKTPAIT